MQDLLTPEQLAEKLGIRPKTVHQLVRDGKLGCVQVTAKERRFTTEQLEEFLEAQTIRPKIRIDKRAQGRLLSPRKGGVKSVKDSVTDLGKEIRDLCQ